MKDVSLIVELLINNVPLSIEKVSFHYQEIPYPGGNVYKLKLYSNSIDLNDYFTNIKNGMVKLQKKDMENFFLELGFLFYDNGLSMGIKEFEYMLNRIDSISISVNEVIIEGICSRFIKSQK